LPESVGTELSQCAEAISTARGFGSSRPRLAHASLDGVTSMPFIGEPCEMKSVGSRDMACSYMGADGTGTILAGSSTP
jgi:hypothetical protein